MDCVHYEKMTENDAKGIIYGLFFQKDDIHSTFDLLKDINIKYKQIRILPVVKNKNYEYLEGFYKIGIERICFENHPDKVLEEMRGFINYYEKSEKTVAKKPYIINFYESLNSFFIDISGELKKEKLQALKLMFENYLSNKMHNLRGVIYIFNNTDEESLVFQNIWGLFRIWHEINIDYDKVFFLTTSETIIRRIRKYIMHLGVKHFSSLLDIVKLLYPEKSKLDEMEIFEFAASLLENQNRGVSSK